MTCLIACLMTSLMASGPVLVFLIAAAPGCLPDCMLIASLIRFVLSEETKTLTWPKEASTSDAVLIAGALRANTTLTAFNLAPGATIDSKARSEIGNALLTNPDAQVAYCNDFGLFPNVDRCEFDLSRSDLKDVEPFRLLAGCLRGNRMLIASDGS